MNYKGHFKFKLSTFSAWQLIKFIAALVVAVPLLLGEKVVVIFKNKMK